MLVGHFLFDCDSHRIDKMPNYMAYGSNEEGPQLKGEGKKHFLSQMSSLTSAFLGFPQLMLMEVPSTLYNPTFP